MRYAASISTAAVNLHDSSSEQDKDEGHMRHALRALMQELSTPSEQYQSAR